MSYSLIPMYHPRRWKVLVYFAADPTTLPQLPTEVWEHVLDQLDVSHWWFVELRRRTFAACCSTCRTWLPRSRYHLFKQVTVQSKEQVKQVSKVLHSNPVLRTRVEKLTVRGSSDAKKDASWIGLVGFHLGPKIKALEKISILHVDLSLTNLDSYQFWGTFNKAWRLGVGRELKFDYCKVNHVNQLVRLAFLTKAEELYAAGLELGGGPVPALPVPALPRGITLPLHRMTIHSPSPEFVSTGSWHTLARRCPSLSTVDITCGGGPSLQSPDYWLVLVSIFDMFRCMQRHNNTNNITLSGFGSFSKIEMKTRPDDASTGNTPPTARPYLRRELVLHTGSTWDSMEKFAQVLTWFEDAIVLGATNVNRGFHSIKFVGSFTEPPIRELCQPLDTILSRLRVTTPDAHLIIEGKYPHYNECVLLWAGECFPVFCQLLPSAFCDVGGGWPCPPHPTQAGRKEQRQEAKVEEGVIREATQREKDVWMYKAGEETDEEMEGEQSEPENEIRSTMVTWKRKATEGLEVEEERARGKGGGRGDGVVRWR